MKEIHPVWIGTCLAIGVLLCGLVAATAQPDPRPDISELSMIDLQRLLLEARWDELEIEHQQLAMLERIADNTSAAEPVMGDANHDGVVNLLDLSAVGQAMEEDDE